jgi:hypothetical protein
VRAMGGKPALAVGGAFFFLAFSWHWVLGSRHSVQALEVAGTYGPLTALHCARHAEPQHDDGNDNGTGWEGVSGRAATFA